MNSVTAVYGDGGEIIGYQAMDMATLKGVGPVFENPIDAYLGKAVAAGVVA